MPADKLVRNIDLFKHIAIDKQFSFFTHTTKYMSTHRTLKVALRKSWP